MLTVPLTFGQALRALQGVRKNTDVARAALGPDATANEVRDFANYYSKIALDRVPNVGLQQIALIAKGLGIPTVSAFFIQIEGLQTGAPPAEDQVHGEITHAAAHDDATEGSLAYIAAKTLGDAIRALQQRCDKLEAEAAAAHRRQAASGDDETREHSGLRRRAARRAARRNPKSRRRPPKR